VFFIVYVAVKSDEIAWCVKCRILEVQSFLINSELCLSIQLCFSHCFYKNANLWSLNLIKKLIIICSWKTIHFWLKGIMHCISMVFLADRVCFRPPCISVLNSPSNSVLFVVVACSKNPVFYLERNANTRNASTNSLLFLQLPRLPLLYVCLTMLTSVWCCIAGEPLARTMMFR